MAPDGQNKAGGSGLADHVELRLIGGFGFGSPNTVKLGDRRKACALLAYLALAPSMRETRGRLAALLWSDSDEDHARSSLRQTIRDLHKIEEQAGCEFLLVDKLNVSLNTAVVRTDLAALQNALARHDYTALEQLLAEGNISICLGLEDCDPAFETWARMQSLSFSDHLVSVLSKEMARTGLTRPERRAMAACLLRVDPFHEAAALEMLAALHRDGGLPRADAFYRSFTGHLRRELDLPPPQALAEAFVSLKQADPSSGSASRRQHRQAAEGEPAEWPRLALLTTRPSPDADHLLMALVSELCAALSRFRHWTAVPVEMEEAALRNASPADLRQACGSETDLALQILRRTQSSRFEIACFDLNTADRQFEMEVPIDHAEWPSLFNAISAQVASRLQTALSGSRLLRVDRLSSNYSSAYDSWLDGQRLSLIWKKESEAQAIDRFEEAIRRDPTLACAHSSLAAVLNSRWIVLPGYPVESADLAHAYELSRAAVTLDPLDHRNHINLAWSHLLAHRWELADFHFGLAHRLNAANPATLIAYALGSSFIGEHDRACALLTSAIALNPGQEAHYQGYRCSILFFARDFPGCIEAVEKSDNLFPDIHGWAAAAHALMGQDRKAIAAFRSFQRDLSQAWHDHSRPGRATMLNWFKQVFPIRLESDRALLAQAIDKAAACEAAAR